MYFGPKIFTSNLFWTLKFWTKFLFLPTIFMDLKCFWTSNFLDLKFFGPQFFLDPKLILTQNLFGPLGPTLFWTTNFFQTKHSVLTKIFFWTKYILKDPQHFGAQQNFLKTQNFVGPNFLDPKFVRTQKIVGP